MRLSAQGDYPLTWRLRARLGERFGQPCRVLAVGKLNNALVEFEDGFRVITSRFAVRRPVSAPRPPGAARPR